MKHFLIVAILLFTGCDFQVKVDLGHPEPISPQPTAPIVIREERPTVNVPEALRQINWAARNGDGSCTWASTITLLHWQGQYELARWLRRNYSGGEYPSSWMVKADRAGLRYALTRDGDVSFLEWAMQTRRGAAVVVRGGAHMVNLVHLDEEWAGLVDNNAPSKVKWLKRDRFIAEWQSSNGWALTPVYSPAAPLPQN